MSTDQPRQPTGTPTGGQWAPSPHAEPDIDLSCRSVDHAEARRRTDRIATLFDDLPQDDFKQSSVWRGSGYFSPFAAQRDVAQRQLHQLMPVLSFDLPTRRSVNALSKKFAAHAEQLRTYRSECEEWLSGPDWGLDKVKRGIEWATRYINAYTRAAAQLSALAKGRPPASRGR